MTDQSGKVTSLSQYIAEIISNSASKNLMCYRGQSDAKWKPVPGVYRDNHHRHAEERSIRELISDAPESFRHDRSMFEKLVKAQHYKLPTRLLDVSLNPLVALYFACVGNPEDDGRIYTFEILDERRTLQFDSDRMSLISNLARLSDVERDKINSYLSKPSIEKHGAITSAKFKNWFNRCPEVKRLVQFVRVEKPYFLNEVIPRNLKQYYFVWPKRSHPRLVAQSGAFLAAGLLKFSGLQRSRSIDVKEYTIPSNHKETLLSELDVMHINARALFPEIENVAAYIQSKYTIKNV
ncbi:FRG domain-containing protein [Yoonia sp.]|uniref:FRG domain-containing protein n=1 Tax=Yoonia sp. TaxID=2212373 RepID=UPI0023862B1E|nr:FRG domain-containing protein [Yoonia sp.]MDE0850905.1 FRG domain-containing protein [Yoonia sp.]